jgi:hypothetical protein
LCYGERSPPKTHIEEKGARLTIVLTLFSVSCKSQLSAVSTIVPSFIRQVPTEEAPQLFRSRVLAVEEAAGGEVVGFTGSRELLVRGECQVRIILQVAQAT